MANVHNRLDRLSRLVLQTRPLALFDSQAAVQKNLKWRPRYRCGPRIAVAPPMPLKFLDIGTKMGCYDIRDHNPGRDDTSNVLHPLFVGEGIPPVNTFHAIVHDRAATKNPDGEAWCLEEAWFAHSPNHDFRVKEPPGNIWGLPVIVPTCPKKLFALGPRKKYVDIVTDTLHASSSDLITCNTLVMMKLNWINSIPRQWIETTTQSLESWKARDEHRQPKRICQSDTSCSIQSWCSRHSSALPNGRSRTI